MPGEGWHPEDRREGPGFVELDKGERIPAGMVAHLDQLKADAVDMLRDSRSFMLTVVTKDGQMITATASDGIGGRKLSRHFFAEVVRVAGAILGDLEEEVEGK